LEKNPNYRQEYANGQFQKRQLKNVWKEVDRRPILDKIDAIDNNIRQISKSIESQKLIKVNALKAEYAAKVLNEKKRADIMSKRGQRNNIISYILMFMTLLNDFIAIMFARNIAERKARREVFLSTETVQRYKKFRAFLKVWLLKKEKGNTLHVNEIKLANPSWVWETETSILFNIMQSAKIIEVTEKSKGLFVMDRLEAIKAFDTYFDEYFAV
jgi:hypothetical protein